MKKISVTTCMFLFLIMFTSLINSSVEGLTIGGSVNTNIILPPPPLPLLDARDDTTSTDEDTPVTIDVLSNDSYIGLGSTRITSVAEPSSGTAVINADNTITYAPNQDFAGSDSFDYTISDETRLLSDTATVHVTVNPVNNDPVANDDTAETNENTSVTIDVLLNDIDPDRDTLTVDSISIQPGNGVSMINPDNTITYAPNQDFAGSDSFDYTISDGKGGTDTASVFVIVKEVNDFTIKRIQSGLVAFDPLNNETQTKDQIMADQSYWHYGGSADSLFNPPAQRDLFKDSQGLHIGVQTPTKATYAGYFAVTPRMNASLFHAVIGTETRTIPSDFFINGLYVQTFNGMINYVTCVSVTSIAGTSWHLARAEGNATFSTKVDVLWSDASPNQPLTRECTIITNGDNYLKLYMDGVKVYENSTLSLKMPGPFNYFLEPQNSHNEMLYGIYKDFYAASDENIKITNTPVTAARVDIVDSSGNVLASGPVISDIATLNIGQYHFPLAANIKVYDINNILLTSTSSPVSITGGDVYSVSQ